MRRDPYEKYKTEHLNSIQLRNIKPIFFYTKCKKCGYEYKNETMFQCSFLHPLFEKTCKFNGCSHCFQNKEAFRKYLEDQKYLYTEETLD